MRNAGNSLENRIVFLDAEESFNVFSGDANRKSWVEIAGIRDPVKLSDAVFFCMINEVSRPHVLGSIPEEISEDDYSILREFIDRTEDRNDKDIQAGVSILMALCFKYGIGFKKDTEFANVIVEAVPLEYANDAVREMLVNAVFLTDNSLLEALLMEGANPNSRRADDSLSPLVVAVGCKNISGVKMLIEYGADKDLFTGWGTAKDFVQEVNSPEIKDVLNENVEPLGTDRRREKAKNKLQECLYGSWQDL